MKTFAISKTGDSRKAGSTTGLADRLWHKQTPAVRQVLHGRIAVQPKLTIGTPDDAYEREADRVADRVMRLSDAEVRASPAPTKVRRLYSAFENAVGTLRRTPYSPYSLSEGRIVQEDEEAVLTKADTGSGAEASPSASAKVEAAVRRPGTELPTGTRRFMESRLGYGLGGVRIHSDGAADEAAKSINARAFTKGSDIVFANGQYAPDSQSGRWLLAHEMTHVVQQQKALPLSGEDATNRLSRRGSGIATPDPSAMLRRVKWGTARDTGTDSLPWGTGPDGDVYEVKTDAGTTINAWKPHDGQTYWCHGYTFGGAAAAGGPFSIWGQDVPTVLKDDGWRNTYGCMAQAKDILVFSANNVAHSGIVYSISAPAAVVDENASLLDSKWGQLPLNRKSWAINANQYGLYQVFSKAPLTGVCDGKGAHER